MTNRAVPPASDRARRMSRETRLPPFGRPGFFRSSRLAARIAAVCAGRFIAVLHSAAALTQRGRDEEKIDQKFIFMLNVRSVMHMHLLHGSIEEFRYCAGAASGYL